MIVNDTRYGRRKARRHAQDEANRRGRRVYFQLDGSVYASGGQLAVLVTEHNVMLPGAPFHTIYPEQSPTIETGRDANGADTFRYAVEIDGETIDLDGADVHEMMKIHQAIDPDASIRGIITF